MTAPKTPQQIVNEIEFRFQNMAAKDPQVFWLIARIRQLEGSIVDQIKHLPNDPEFCEIISEALDSMPNNE